MNNNCCGYGDLFGSAVNALNGNKVVIGESRSDANYLFDAATGGLLRTFFDPNPNGGFAFEASSNRHIAMDGDHILIGDRLDDTHGQDIGQAYLFDVTTGVLSHTFNDPTITTGDNFGQRVAMDGNHVLIGARFDDTNGQNVGQAHLFDVTTGNLLHTFNDPTITTEDGFGVGLAMDGNHVLIGAQFDDTNGVNAGQVHLFDGATGDLLNTFNSPNPIASEFGRGVAIDGNFALIGARFDGVNGQHPDLGQAYLFNVTTGDLVQTFDDPTITVGDLFGNFRAVAIDGNRVLIGAEGDDTNGEGVGQAYLFTAVADFNGDGLIDCVDVDRLVMEIVAGTNNSTYDLTGDGLVNVDDLDEWRVQGGAVNLPSGNPYLPGDANLNGDVDGSDFGLWNANKFTSVAAWCSGDFNANGVVDGSDFGIWNANKFTSANRGAAVPEPGCVAVLIPALVGCYVLARTGRKPSGF